ncbi:hypothetical protein PBDP_4172 [Pseudomonas sp. St290]|nr:hypothetical protein PBDP_4172 [Pseudomonas sp. St290]
MQPERRLLHVGGFRLVVIVKAGFTNGDNPWMVELTQQPIERRRGVWLDIQRVDTDRAIDIGITFGQCLDVGGVVGADADAQEVTDTPLAGRVQRSIQGAAVGSEVETVKVTMGIYKHKGLGYIVWVGRSDFREPAKWVSI